MGRVYLRKRRQSRAWGTDTGSDLLLGLDIDREQCETVL